MDVALSAAQWVVGKALAPVIDGVLEAWGASKNLGVNIEALRTELLLVKATLDIASDKEIRGQAMEELLQKLRDSAHGAEDLLDELDYFRIRDQLHSTYDAADQHGKGGIHDLVLNARHTTKAVGKLACVSTCWPAASPTDPGQEDAREPVSCYAWPRAKHRARGNSSSGLSSNQADGDVRGCMPKLGKLLPCSSSPHVHDDDETPNLGFNRVHVSERIKCIIDELQPVRREVTTILQSCGRRTVPDIAQSRPITTGQSIEEKLYGRDCIINSIIDDMTKGKYCGNDLAVIPIVGPGGIGKTTLIQHIYRNQEVQNHFQVRIWVCVSLSFNLNKVLEEIKTQIPQVKGEKEGTPTEDLIEQRLKFRRSLLVLDDMWVCSNQDDWKRLLLPLKRSQEKGSMILVTTRFPAIAKMVKRETSDNSIELGGLESEEFRKLFHAFVFSNEQCRRDHDFLLKIGDKIMKKLKGSPLAAKTVGGLLSKNLSLHHWIKVLESKEWEGESGVNDIMPALKLSYDYLPFQQQQCFSFSALFPEDYKYRSSELINLWIGLDILKPDGQNKTVKDIGQSNLNDLVTHGFFKEEGTDDYLHYVMHDLLHDLALKVASHECLSLHHSNVGTVKNQPCIRHLSIIIDEKDVGHDNAVSGKKFKSELTKLKTKLDVQHLHTLMLFGEMDENFASILGDLFRKANGLRILRLINMSSSVESLLHNFSSLVHLRYLCLGTKYGMEMHLPVTISRFYHLRILDLKSWYQCHDLPEDMSNLAKLHHFYTPYDQLHSDICNVGKLELLEELKAFKVNKKSKGFETKQLEHLTELRELGIYNLEKIHTTEEADSAKLIEKNYLERLTLDWDSKRSSTEPDVDTMVLESLQPNGYLQELCIRGHTGPSCPSWLGDELVVEALQSLHLSSVSWEVLPSVGNMWDLRKLVLEHIGKMKEFVIEQSFCRLTSLKLIGLENFEKWVPSLDTRHQFPVLQVLWISNCPKLLRLPFSNNIVCPPDQECYINWFPKLQELCIDNCPEFLLAAHVPWTETLYRVNISCVKLLEEFEYSKSSYRVELRIVGKDELFSFSLDQVLAFSKLTGLEELRLEKCPPLELKHLLMLTSLKKLSADCFDGLVGPLGGHGDAGWIHPVEYIQVWKSCGNSGKELSELLTHLPRLSELDVRQLGKLTHLAVGMDPKQATSATAEPTVEQEKEEDGVLLLPPHLSDTLQVLRTYKLCHNDIGGGGLQALRSLQRLDISSSHKFPSSCGLLFSSPSRHVFPSSLQFLALSFLEGMGTLEPLSNLTSLTELQLSRCGKDLRCEGLGPLLTGGGQLRLLTVYSSPRFFTGWNPNTRRVLQGGGGGQDKQLQLVSPLPSSSKLQELMTDDAAGLLVAPICSLLSSSLIKLKLHGTKEMERFSKEQEEALQLLASLQELEFSFLEELQHLPEGLHKLTNLKRLSICFCRSVRSLPEGGLPESLQELGVLICGNEELKQQCRGLVGEGTVPKIIL